MSAPAKPKYRTTNWKEYNASLKARGALLIWLDKDRCWHGSASGKRGRGPTYSEAAALRQAMGMAQGLLKLSGLDWQVPDFGTVSRRQKNLAIWKKWTGYHRCSLVETKMRCFKLLGERVMARDFDRQVAALQVRAAILNRFTRLGTPKTVAMP
jgi:hypothetical protein